MNTTATPASGPAASSKGKAVDVVVEINLVDGVEAERLCPQQVIRNVCSGSDETATASPDASVT